MTRHQLEQMYLDIFGEKNVNEMWLATMDDDEIIGVITEAGKLGNAVAQLTPSYHTAVLRHSLSAHRREVNQ